MADFLTVEIETGQTFLRMASTTGDIRKKSWYLENARKAHDTIVRFIDCTMLNKKQRSEIESDLHELRGNLERLEQGTLASIDAAADATESPATEPRSRRGSKEPHERMQPALSDRVRLFQLLCQEIREHARIMIKQNHELMHVKRHTVQD
jgi:hypothetical protein